MEGTGSLVTLPTWKDALGHNGHVKCACGRVTNADMCHDLRTAPGHVAAAKRMELTPENAFASVHPALGLQAAVTIVAHADVLCDGCRERLTPAQRAKLGIAE